MARNMSFFYTQEQIRSRTKTVTRRLGWWKLNIDDVVNACVKCQGLKKGEKIEVICQIRIVSVGMQPLNYLIRPDVIFPRGCMSYKWPRMQVDAEGFPDLSPAEFVAMFCRHMKCEPDVEVNVIEFEYL